MAEGRILNRSISLSTKFHLLPDDTCRLLATWIIPHLDKNGVFYGDATVVKSLVLPMREDISVETVDGYIQAMQSVGLLIVYEADGRRWQWWTGFSHNQSGYIDREKTRYPAPPDEGQTISIESGLNLDQDAPERKGKRKGNINESEREIDVASAPSPHSDPCVMQSTVSDPEPKGATQRPRDLLFDAIADVTASNPKLLGSRIAKCAKNLRRVDATPDQVQQVATWYQACDWRGQRGDKLTFSTLEEVWDAGIKNLQPAKRANGKANEPAGFAAIRECMTDPRYQ